MYGDSVLLDSSLHGSSSSILSQDGKNMITYSDTDLVRAGLADPEHRIHVKAHDRTRPPSELEDESVDPDTKPQSAAQIARRVAATNRVMDGLVPTHIPAFDERHQVTLFESKQVNIQFNKKAGQNIFHSMQVKTKGALSPRDGGNNAIYVKQGSLSSNSSVYKEGFQMKFHHHLRMHTCLLHGQSMIYSAIRHNDFALMEAICKQIKDSEDIDFENIYGDTVLTLACRMGKLNFVELLVEHMADVNKETSNGRTGTYFEN